MHLIKCLIPILLGATVSASAIKRRDDPFISDGQAGAAIKSDPAARFVSAHSGKAPRLTHFSIEIFLAFCGQEVMLVNLNDFSNNPARPS